MKYIYVEKAKNAECIHNTFFHFKISKFIPIVYLISNCDCFRPVNIWDILDKTFYLLYSFNCFLCTCIQASMFNPLIILTFKQPWPSSFFLVSFPFKFKGSEQFRNSIGLQNKRRVKWYRRNILFNSYGYCVLAITFILHTHKNLQWTNGPCG